MRLAVLLLVNSDQPRVTTFDRAWVERVVAHTAEYFASQSGGRRTLTFSVSDWITLPMTVAEWNSAGFDVGPRARAIVEEQLSIDLSAFTNYALVIDNPASSSAAVSSTQPQYVHMGARTLDAAILEHELGHFLGAGHANLYAPDGPKEYEDPFCIMGREDGKYSYTHSPLNLTIAGRVSTANSDSGPGMVAPTLLACGWLDPQAHGIDITAQLHSAQRRAEFRLLALRGAPLPDLPAPVFAYARGVTDQIITVEARWRDGFDRGMPDPGPGGGGWVLVHEATALGRGTTTALLASLPARQGATAYLPNAQVGIKVESVNVAAGAVSISMTNEARPTRYASIWEPADGVPWRANHGLSVATYQTAFTELATQGYRPVDVDVHTSGGHPRFSSIWRQEAGPAWEARHGLDSDHYQRTFDDLTRRGFRPLCVSGYSDGGQVRYAAVWSNEPGPEWIARHGLTTEQYQQLFTELPALGFRPWRVNAYSVGGTNLFASIWHKSPGEWVARHDLTADEHQSVVAQLSQEGFKLVDVSGYGSRGEDRYACIWQKAPDPWAATHGLTPFRYQQEFDSQVGRGQRIVRVSGHNSLG